MDAYYIIDVPFEVRCDHRNPPGVRLSISAGLFFTRQKDNARRPRVGRHGQSRRKRMEEDDRGRRNNKHTYANLQGNPNRRRDQCEVRSNPTRNFGGILSTPSNRFHTPRISIKHRRDDARIRSRHDRSTSRWSGHHHAPFHHRIESRSCHMQSPVLSTLIENLVVNRHPQKSGSY